MRRIYIIVFCLLLMGCTENNVTSEDSSKISNVNNQIIYNQVNNNQVANEAIEEVENNEDDNSSENTTSESSLEVNEEEFFETFKIVVRVDELNVRSGPSVDAEKLSTIALYTDHIVYDKYVDDETGEYWYKIQLEDSSTGWIAGWFVTRDRGGAMALYSDMSLDADLVAYVEPSKIESKKIRGIESDRRLISWFETEFLGQTVYFGGYADMMTVTWPIYYKTDHNLEEFAFSEENPGKISLGYREIFIESSEGLIYINEEERKIYKENKSLGQTTLELDEKYSYGETHELPEGYLYMKSHRNGFQTFKRLYSSSDAEVWCYEIIGNQLKEKKVFQLEFTRDNQFVHAYDSPYKIINREVSEYEYTGYVKDEDVLGYRRYFDGYSTFDVIVANVNDKEMYASYDAYSTDDEVTVVLPNNDKFMMTTQSNIIGSPLYERGYINYEIDYSYYTTNYLSDIVLAYNNLFYINDDQHMVIRKGSKVSIYDIRSSDPTLLIEFEVNNGISEVIEYDDLLLIEHSYFYGTYLRRNGDDYELIYNYDNVAPVFEAMDLTSDFIETDSMENRADYEIILQVLADKMLAWYDSGKGYILKEVYDRNHINEGLSYSYVNNEFDQITNSSGQVVSSDVTQVNLMPTNVLDSPYIIVKSSDKFYSVNLVTLAMTYLGTDAKHISDSDYIMTYSEDEKGSKIDLYRIGQTFEHLDTYEIDMFGGKISHWRSDRDFISYSDYEGLQSVNQFLHHTVVFDIEDDALNPKIDDSNIFLDLYDAINYKSPIARRLNSEEMINPVNLNTLQLMGDKIIGWYEVEIDTQKYYVYKRLNQMEPLDYAGEILDIILEDDSIIGFNTGGDASRYLVYDFLGYKGYLTLYHAWEGIYGSVINMTTGKKIYDMPYDPVLSPDGNLMVGHDVSYGEGNTSLTLHSFEENDIEEVASFNIDQWNVHSVAWLSNDEVAIKVYSDRNTTRNLRLVKEDDLWLIEEAAE